MSTFLFVEISGAFLVGGAAGAGLARAGYRRMEARDANLDRLRTAAVRRQWDRVLRALPGAAVYLRSHASSPRRATPSGTTRTNDPGTSPWGLGHDAFGSRSQRISITAIRRLDRR